VTPRYKIWFTDESKRQFIAIRDGRARQAVVRSLDRLEQEPERQGKPLSGDLRGYRSVRSAGQRYRIIYRVDGILVVVVIVTIGLRREGDKHDAYALAQKLLQAGLLDARSDDSYRKMVKYIDALSYDSREIVPHYGD